ncbi:hypothetical protein ACP8Y2_11595 [Herpetosiphon llansteffanensis]
MGIRQSFVRVTTQQLDELEKIAANKDDSVSDDRYEKVYEILNQRSHLQTYTMVPMDEISAEQVQYKFTIEKSYWSLLEDLMKQLVDDQVIAYWPITEDSSLPIGDFSMGYSYLHLISYDDLPALLEMVQNFSYEQLKQYFDADFAEFTDMTDDEKQDVYEAVVDCLASIHLMAQQAYAANESIVWYIG